MTNVQRAMSAAQRARANLSKAQAARRKAEAREALALDRFMANHANRWLVAQLASPLQLVLPHAKPLAVAAASRHHVHRKPQATSFKPPSRPMSKGIQGARPKVKHRSTKSQNH